MLPIVNFKAIEEILLVSCSILEKNFFYEKDTIHEFLNIFSEHMAHELTHFELSAEPEIIDELQTVAKARLHFTCYIVSAILRRVFISELHFTEQELYAFDNILPTFTGEKPNEAKSKFKRTHYRKFFK